VEVCQGTDCAGSGGGAALLEIEELVAEIIQNGSSTPSLSALSVVPGGCRNMCSLGPNVRINAGADIFQEFHRVDGPARCAEAVAAGLPPGSGVAPDPPKPPTPAARRADRMRWGALRDCHRAISRAKRHGPPPRLASIVGGCVAKIEAATGTEPLDKMRAERRRARLVRRVTAALKSGGGGDVESDSSLSSSSSSSGDCDSSDVDDR